MRTTHGACGAVWNQIGNRTSHCGQCHQTFSSLSGFDRHQYLRNQELHCREPLTLGMVAKVDRYGATVWSLPGGYWGKTGELAAAGV